MVTDPSDLLPSGSTGIFGAALAAIIAGVLWLRRFLSGDAVDRKGDGAQIGVISMLNTQITMLNQQLAGEQARNEKLQAALDNASTQIASLRSQILELTLQVQTLQRKMPP